jgi:hypothetical protein
VFAKGGDTETRMFLEPELRVYEQLDGSFSPRFIAADIVGDAFVLVLADLSQARWPPVWDDSLIEQAFASLDKVHAATATGIPQGQQSDLDAWPNWGAVLEASDRVCDATGLTRDWLATHAGALRDLASSARVGGATFVHGDTHAGNVCSVGERALWVDWSSAHLGDPAEDFALLATSIAADGGPLCPLSDNALAIVAFNAATWLVEAGVAPPAWGPGLPAIRAHLWRGALRLLVAAGVVTAPD